MTVVDVSWHGSEVLTLTYRTADGAVAERLIYREDEPRLHIVEEGKPWSFDGDGDAFQLACEAKRIDLAYLFDPMWRSHDLVEPLPHQITAVYEAMLPRQPLRFLLADDPGAGKTIMAGLYIRELIIRGDAPALPDRRPGQSSSSSGRTSCREVRPRLRRSSPATGSKRRRAGNPFDDHDQLIARLDQLSRNEELQAKLDKRRTGTWSSSTKPTSSRPTFFGGEVKKTEALPARPSGSAGITRHLLLMTATPHNGKEEDFQLSWRCSTPTASTGKFRDGVHKVDASDLMRRMVKEELVKFDGTPLFPERMAYTVNYKLSDAEAALYEQVTELRPRRDEPRRALKAEGEGSAGYRSASPSPSSSAARLSPEAIHQSLKRRRERLERPARRDSCSQRDGAQAADQSAGTRRDDRRRHRRASTTTRLTAEEQEAARGDASVDQATAAQTIAELEARDRHASQELEAQAAAGRRRSGTDRKWDELSKLLQDQPEMRDAGGAPAQARSSSPSTATRSTTSSSGSPALLGRPEAVVAIHGGMPPRRAAAGRRSRFTHDPDVHRPRGHRRGRRGRQPPARPPDGQLRPALEPEPAGAAVRPHPPHRPDRGLPPLEPRRRGDPRGRRLPRLLEKLDVETEALGGSVFDVLGEVTFEGKPLRQLLIEAIRYGDSPRSGPG